MCIAMDISDNNHSSVHLRMFILAIVLVIPSLLVIQPVQGTDEGIQKDWPPIYTLRGQMDIDSIPLFFPYMPSDLDTDYHIVQFDSPILEQDKQYLRRSGLEVLEYIPEFAFISRCPLS